MRGSQPTSPLRYYRRHHKPQAHSATDATSPHRNRYHDTTSPLRYRRSKPTPLPTLQAHSATDTTSLLRCRRHKPTPLLPTSHFPADATAHATATADAAAHSAIDTAPWLLVASFTAIAICTDVPARIIALRTPPTSFVQLFVLLPVWRVLSFWHAPQLTPVVCGALISRISPSGVSESTGNRRVRWGGSKGAFLSPEPAYAGFIWTCLPPLLPALNAAYTGLLSLFFYIIFSHALL